MDRDRIYERRWWTLGVLMVALLVIGIDNTILNVTLPTLSTELGATASQLQWIVEAYILVFAGLLLLGGAIGDRFGRRRALVTGLSVFGVASLAAAVGDTPNALIVARGVMGVGGALIMPATLSVVTAIFPEGERAKAIGIWSAVSALGVVIGPVTGGWLLDHFWWGSVFLVNVPTAIIAIVAALLVVPESRDPSEARLDPVGAVLSTLGLGALLYAIIEAPHLGWTDPLVLAALTGAAILLAGFVAWELHTDRPMLEVRLFTNPRFTAASLSITLVFFALMGGMFFLTQYLQAVLGYDALGAGIRVIPVAVAIGMTAPQSARLAERFGTKAVVTVGLLTAAGGLLFLANATADSGYPLVAATLVTVGVGIGLAGTPATDSIMGAVPIEKVGIGSAVNDTTREIGGALGVAVLGSALSAGYGTAMVEATAGLPAEAAHVAGDSIGGALAVAAQLGGNAGMQLADAARDAFAQAMGSSVLVGAGVAFLGALVALAYLPSRHSSGTPDQPVLEFPLPEPVG